MTVQTFFPDTYVADTQAYYWLVDGNGRDLMITRKRAAEIGNDPSLPYGWKVERRLVTEYVPACPWCGVRPLVFERDCDGWASTGTCGSEQCNRLNRCEGCGKDHTARFVSIRGNLCEDCDNIAHKTGRVAARDRYELTEHYGETV